MQHFGNLTRSRCLFFLIILFLYPAVLLADELPDMIVGVDGSSDFTSIQSAINHVPEGNTERVVILVKAGIYNEKIFIEKDFITLIGEVPKITCIEYAILRRSWHELHPDDWGSAVINIHADDFIMKNITVRNTYGEIHDDHDHQFAVRLVKGTRIIFDNCHFFSGGGDTVSLWDKQEGMYYHCNCYFQGYVDFVCPRAWCYITNSQFYQLGQKATLWHDGSANRSNKLVICNSHFDGIKGFKLGRRHRDAQFYLINCSFSENMADQPIYRVTYPDDPSKDAPNLWGDRYYFYGSHRASGDYKWVSDNLSSVNSDLQPEDITPSWTFDHRWDPELTTQPEPNSALITNKTVELHFSEIMTVKGYPLLIMRSGLIGTYSGGSGSCVLRFCFNRDLKHNDQITRLDVNNAAVFVSQATLQYRRADLNAFVTKKSISAKKMIINHNNQSNR